MKTFSKAIAFASTVVALTLVGCEPSKSSYEGFLGDQATNAASGGGQTSAAATDRGESRELAEQRSRETITVPMTEWEDVRIKASRCRAEFDSYKVETATALKTEYMKGDQKCQESLDAEKDSVKEAVIVESEKVVEEIRDSLKRYRYPAAVVNGECDGLTSSGERFIFVLRNACLNVVHKKVGNDGEIVGLIDAVSSEAIKVGILHLSCDVGRAHIALLPKKCDVSVATSAGAIEKAGEGSPSDLITPVSAIADPTKVKK